MSDYKKRVQRAIEGYHAKQLPQEFKPKRTNEKPEELVVSDILFWCKQNDFHVHVFESKAKYNVATGRYTGRVASPGTPDIIGNYKNGMSVWIEAKAKGCRTGSNLRDKQREFLTAKIQTGCFAAVVDDVLYLEKIWIHFKSLTPEERKKFLMDELPQHNPRQLKLDL